MNWKDAQETQKHLDVRQSVLHQFRIKSGRFNHAKVSSLVFLPANTNLITRVYLQDDRHHSRAPSRPRRQVLHPSATARSVPLRRIPQHVRFTPSLILSCHFLLSYLLVHPTNLSPRHLGPSQQHRRRLAQVHPPRPQSRPPPVRARRPPPSSPARTRSWTRRLARWSGTRGCCGHIVRDPFARTLLSGVGRMERGKRRGRGREGRRRGSRKRRGRRGGIRVMGRGRRGSWRRGRGRNEGGWVDAWLIALVSIVFVCLWLATPDIGCLSRFRNSGFFVLWKLDAVVSLKQRKSLRVLDPTHWPTRPRRRRASPLPRRTSSSDPLVDMFIRGTVPIRFSSFRELI